MSADRQKTSWARDAFREMVSGWKRPRLLRDNQLFETVFPHIDTVPALAEALGWAVKHDVKYFLDHRCRDLYGYYAPHAGVVAVAHRTVMSPLDFVRTVVHETRHAWQDYHGLLNRNHGDFADSFIKLSLVEADAYAFERRAMREFSLARLKAAATTEVVAEKCTRLEAHLAAHQLDYLARDFMTWFSLSRPKTYGASTLQAAAIVNYLDVPPPPAKHAELAVNGMGAGRAPGLDLSQLANVMELGKTYTGKNYFSRLPPDFLIKQVLRPSLANTFYGAANANQCQLAVTLRKKAIEEKSVMKIFSGKAGATFGGLR